MKRRRKKMMMMNAALRKEIFITLSQSLLALNQNIYPINIFVK
jgi:hypothetical protein